MTLPKRIGECGQVNLLHHGCELFLCHCSGDGWTMQEGSDGDGRWFAFDDCIANFEARYARRRHGKDGASAWGLDALPPLSQQGEGGGGKGGLGAEAM
jgi:hypothetical protein